MRRSAVLVLALLSTGCVSQGPVWVRADGVNVRSTPELYQKAKLDLAVCEGRVASASLSASPVTTSGMMGVADNLRQSRDLDAVAKGCMAERGYVRNDGR